MKKASILKRFAAVFIDGVIVGVICFTLMFIPMLLVTVSTGSLNEESGVWTIFELALRLGITFYYYGYFYSTRGATPGKQLFSLRVVSHEDGTFLSYKQAFLRETIYKFVSGIVLGFGFIVAIFRDDGRAWHDSLTGSIVLADEGSTTSSLQS